jgi:chromosome partitioning protein
MPIICFANQKGGVGKTTSAVNLAAELGASGARTLLCDIDPQGSTTSGVGISKKGVSGTSYDLLIGRTRAPDAVRPTGFAGLDIIPSTIDLAAAELELPSLENRFALLSSALAEISGRYSYIIIDCPPSLGILTLNGLCASDAVIIPMQCEYYALEGLSQLTATVQQVKRLYNPRLTIGGILITMYNGRLNLTGQVIDELEKYYPDKLFKTYIGRNVRLSEAPSYGMPAMYYDPSSTGAIAYREFCAEFKERIPAPKTPR